MASKPSVYYPTPSLSTVYFRVADPGGQAWNGSAYEALDASHWSDYAITMTDSAGVGEYFGTMPAVPNGVVTLAAYLQLGGSVAPTDTRLGSSDYYWDGTNLLSGQSGLPDGSFSRATLAADMRSDGTMRAAPSSGKMHLDATDRIANGSAGTVEVNQYLEITEGLGLGTALIPVLSLSGSSGARDATPVDGFDLPTLDTTTKYFWTGIPIQASGGGGGADLLGVSAYTARDLRYAMANESSANEVIAALGGVNS